jgi:hypothetical protein
MIAMYSLLLGSGVSILWVIAIFGCSSPAP